MALHHATPGEVVRLKLVSDPEAQSITLMRTASFETMHLVVRAGQSLPEHEFAGSIGLYCVEGDAGITLQGTTHSMTAGDWLYLLPQMRHGITAKADTSLLLTLLFDRPEPATTPE
ncbi:MAG: cupin [Sphingobium sp.]